MTDYATPTQIAAYYQISKSMVYKVIRRMLENPETRVVRIGKLMRVPIEDFQAFIEKETREGGIEE